MTSAAAETKALQSQAFEIEKGQVGADGLIDSWTVVDGSGPTKVTAPKVLFADPYDPNYVYTFDKGDNMIKSSSDGGTTWQVDTTLTNLATNYGEFNTVCPKSVRPQPVCALTNMSFDRNAPGLRIATLYPGGIAYSRDYGRHWLPLVGATSPTDIAAATWWDPSVFGQNPALYVGFIGHGVERVNAPFSTLTAITYDLTGIPPGSQVSVRDETTGRTLTPDPGSGAVTELFNSASHRSITYHYIVNGKPGPSATATVGPGEQSSGVIDVQPPQPPPAPTPTPTPTPTMPPSATPTCPTSAPSSSAVPSPSAGVTGLVGSVVGGVGQVLGGLTAALAPTQSPSPTCTATPPPPSKGESLAPSSPSMPAPTTQASTPTPSPSTTTRSTQAPTVLATPPMNEPVAVPPPTEPSTSPPSTSSTTPGASPTSGMAQGPGTQTLHAAKTSAGVNWAEVLGVLLLLVLLGLFAWRLLLRSRP